MASEMYFVQILFHKSVLLLEYQWSKMCTNLVMQVIQNFQQPDKVSLDLWDTGSWHRLWCHLV